MKNSGIKTIIQIWKIVFIFPVLLIACVDKNEASSLETALQMAKENRTELEKVLNRYNQNPSDSLKYKAACFLIENMPYYYYFEGDALDSCFVFYKTLSEQKDVPPDIVLKQHIEKYGRLSMDQLEIKYDIQEIDSAYLCHNIEWSFKVWREQPWGKNVSFEDFCEYILPYRIGNERPTYWKEDFYKRYSPLLAHVIKTENMEDPVTAAIFFMGYLNKDNYRFTTLVPQGFVNVGPYISEYLNGTCEDLANYIAYASRSVGIPCQIDFVPATGRGQHGNFHYWTSYLDKKGELYHQEYINNVGYTRYDGFRAFYKTKVYRQTFSVNRKMEKELLSIEKTVHPFFTNPRFKDVTLFYSDCFKEEVIIPSSKLHNRKSGNRIYYLCVSKRMEWVPVAWGKVEKGNLRFKGIQKGDICIVATYDGKQLIPETQPFLIHCPLGDLQFFDSDKPDSTGVYIYSKASLNDDRQFIERMVGGVFEASNNQDFIHPDTLFIIKDKPYRLQTSILTGNQKKYRYVRYYGPKFGFCNVSEVAFYENPEDSVCLRGQVMGTPGSFQDSPAHTYVNVFDGLTTTSFDYKEDYGGWSGLDLGEPKTISRIVYTPRNRDNYIRPGDTYELFFWDKEWKSLGVKKSESDSLKYEAPQNRLLYLKGHSRGVQERIFSIEENKQFWW